MLRGVHHKEVLISRVFKGGMTCLDMHKSVVWAERDWRNRSAKVYDGAHPNTQVGTWRHEAPFLMAGVAVLLIIGGNGA